MFLGMRLNKFTESSARNFIQREIPFFFQCFLKQGNELFGSTLAFAINQIMFAILTQLLPSLMMLRGEEITRPVTPNNLGLEQLAIIFFCLCLLADFCQLAGQLRFLAGRQVRLGKIFNEFVATEPSYLV